MGNIDALPLGPRKDMCACSDDSATRRRRFRELLPALPVPVRQYYWSAAQRVVLRVECTGGKECSLVLDSVRGDDAPQVSPAMCVMRT